jgi:hypothetical protein
MWSTDYRHVIHPLRRKPMALLGPVYRDGLSLSPRPAYARAFEAVRAGPSDRLACRITVGILALAHGRAREAGLAGALEAVLDAGRLPDVAEPRARFAPGAAAMPSTTISQPPLGACEGIATIRRGDAA